MPSALAKGIPDTCSNDKPMTRTALTVSMVQQLASIQQMVD